MQVLCNLAVASVKKRKKPPQKCDYIALYYFSRKKSNVNTFFTISSKKISTKFIVTVLHKSAFCPNLFAVLFEHRFAFPSAKAARKIIFCRKNNEYPRKTANENRKKCIKSTPVRRGSNQEKIPNSSRKAGAKKASKEGKKQRKKRPKNPGVFKIVLKKLTI